MNTVRTADWFETLYWLKALIQGDWFEAEIQECGLIQDTTGWSPRVTSNKYHSTEWSAVRHCLCWRLLPPSTRIQTTREKTNKKMQTGATQRVTYKRRRGVLSNVTRNITDTVPIQDCNVCKSPPTPHSSVARNHQGTCTPSGPPYTANVVTPNVAPCQNTTRAKRNPCCLSHTPVTVRERPLKMLGLFQTPHDRYVVIGVTRIML